ncbi:MAG: hypothetical protein AAB642_00770 [Patescibacteria group bacterium]
MILRDSIVPADWGSFGYGFFAGMLALLIGGFILSKTVYRKSSRFFVNLKEEDPYG